MRKLFIQNAYVFNNKAEIDWYQNKWKVSPAEKLFFATK